MLSDSLLCRKPGRLTSDIRLWVLQRLPYNTHPETLPTPCAMLMICLQSTNDIDALFFSEHLRRLWEVLENEKGGEREQNRCETLKDEYPSPSMDASHSVHVVDRRCEQAA